MAEKAKSFKSLPKILIIDDEPFNIIALSSLIEKIGYKVESEYTADKALVKLRESYAPSSTPFTHVITDFNMPGMSGLEFINKCKQVFKMQSTKYYVLTGGLSSNETDQINNSGASGIMYKPPTIDKLK